MNKEVKLRCLNVWKVYGADADRFFAETSDLTDTDRAMAQMRAAGCVPAAAKVDFDVHVGEIFVIMGLSGSGKSTIVRCLSRLIEPSHGVVLMDGEDVLKMSPAQLIQLRRHRVGMVFQNFGLLPNLTVLQNIVLPLKLQGQSLAQQKESAHRVIELVGLTGRETAYPRELSGGQQQRVGIARSLAVEPEFWFLDEPFSALDPLIRRNMQDEFLRLQTALKKSIVFITHDFQEALRIADRMMIMRDGRVIQIGTPAELMLNPVDDYVRDFSKGVSLTSALTAGMVAKNRPQPGITYTRIDPSSRIDDILPLLAKHSEGLQVSGDDGGVLTPALLVRAMARDLAAP